MSATSTKKPKRTRKPRATKKRPSEPEAPKRWRVAVTGGKTWLGEQVIAALERDERCEHILVLDIGRPDACGEKSRYVRVDLTRPDADAKMADLLKDDRIEVLCHMAFLALPSHNSSWAHEVEAIGSLYVMNAAAAAGVHKVVMSSTTMVYGAHSHNPHYLTEDEPLRGTRRSRWVNDKVSAERELVRLKQDAPQMVTTSLRFGIIVGPTVKGFFTRVLGRDVLVGLMGYDPLMQFLHEDDAVKVMMKCIWEDHQGAFNIVGDGVLYYSDVARLGGRVALKFPHFLFQPATSLLWGAQLVDFPGNFLDFFRYAWCGDSTRMREVMGFHPTRTSRDALLEYFAHVGHARSNRETDLGA